MIDLEAFLDALSERVAQRVLAALPAAPPVEEWRVLTIEDACARLGRSERTLRGWVKEGSLPCVRLDGGALGFLLPDLVAFAKARRVGAETASALAGRLHEAQDAALRDVSRGDAQPRGLRVR